MICCPLQNARSHPDPPYLASRPVQHSRRKAPKLTGSVQTATIELETRFIPKLRQFAASLLLAVALIHVCGTPASALIGHPVELNFGCDSLGIVSSLLIAGASESNETDSDTCSDSCCFCCCSHVLGESSVLLARFGWSSAEPVLTLLYRADQTIKPGLLPPRG